MLGPDLLRNSLSYNLNEESCDVINLPELREINVLITVSPEISYIGDIIDITRFNDLMKLFRITAYVLRFCYNMKSKLNRNSLRNTRYLVSSEINEARRTWVIDNQKDFNLNDSSMKQLKVNLNLKYDESGIIRSYSRLKNAVMPFETKSPMFIQRNHKLAELIVGYSHLKVLHRGVKQTLTELRTFYWITRGRSFVQKLIRHCMVCNRINARSYEYPIHSDLPTFRFSDICAFNCTGTDYLGPVLCLPVTVMEINYTKRPS